MRIVLDARCSSKDQYFDLALFCVGDAERRIMSSLEPLSQAAALTMQGIERIMDRLDILEVKL